MSYASANSDLVDCLIRHDLFLLAMVFQSIDYKYSEVLRQVILKDLGLDLVDAENVRLLSEEDINRLKQFEIDNKNYLLSSANHHPRHYYPEKDKLVRELNFKYIITFILIIATLVYLFAVTFFQIPEENKNTANTTIGVLITTVIGAIVSYFYKRDKKDDDEK